MKKLLPILFVLLLVPSFAFAAPTSWDFANSILQPLQSAWSALVKASRFQATSTTQASIFPYASTTALSATTLCLTADCRTTWPEGGSGSGTATTSFAATWPLTLTTSASNITYGFDGLSTSSPIAAASGLLYATGVKTVASVSTSSPISMSISGNAGTVTNGVYTTGADSVYLTPGTAASTYQVIGNYLTGVSASSPLSGAGTVGSPLVLDTSGTWSGNAGTATKLATARNINGVAFDGTADITIPSGSFEWTPTTNFGALANSTSTPIWFTVGIMASTSNNYMGGLTLDDSAGGGATYILDVTRDSSGGDIARFTNLDATGFANNKFTNNDGDDAYVGVGGTGLNVAYAGRSYIENIGNGVSLIADSTGDIRFYTTGTLDVDERVRLTSAGNFGIGTTSPLSLFSIGTAGNAFRVDTTGTVKEGIWNGTAIDDAYVASAATWNAKLSSVTADAPLSGAGTSASHLTCTTAASGIAGCLSSTMYDTFNGKQATLVSGTNIKTVNGTTLLGSGDLGTIGLLYGGTATTTGGNTGGISFFNGTYFTNLAAFNYDSALSRLTVTNASTTNLTVSTLFQLPNGSSIAPTLVGACGIDTTSGQLKCGDGTNSRVYGNGFQTASFTYATSTAWTATTTIPLGTAYYAETWSGVQCFTDAGTLNVSFYDGTNRMNMFNASTTAGTVVLSTNSTFTAGEKRYADIGTPATSPTKISCTVNKSLTAD